MSTQVMAEQQTVPVRIAYIMSRFPKLSETFILNEMIALEKFGARVDVYPLLRERQAVSHPEVEAWIGRARYLPFITLSILAANLHFLVRHPGRYMRMVVEVLRGTWGSRKFLIGALGVLPKSVRFAYEMQRSGVRHVHAHFATHATVAALIVHRLTGIPFSFTAHGSDVYVDRRMLRQKVDAAKFVATVSQFNRAIFVDECGDGPASKVHVVHCGVDPGFFSPMESRTGDVLAIVCVAVLEEKKGHRFLIDACALLLAHGLEFRCHLVGDGPLRRELEQRVAAAGLTDRVVLHGGKPRRDVAELMARCDIAVLASHRTGSGKMEGIPVALMEAMACGLPVVATIMTGVPELVGHEVEGLLVPSGDPAALAGAIERLARDPGLRIRFGSAARSKVLDGFDLEANAARLLQLMAGAATERLPVSARASSPTIPRSSPVGPAQVPGSWSRTSG